MCSHYVVSVAKFVRLDVSVMVTGNANANGWGFTVPVPVPQTALDWHRSRYRYRKPPPAQFRDRNYPGLGRVHVKNRRSTPGPTRSASPAEPPGLSVPEPVSVTRELGIMELTVTTTRAFAPQRPGVEKQ